MTLSNFLDNIPSKELGIA